MIQNYVFFTSDNLNTFYNDLHVLLNMVAPGIMIYAAAHLLYLVATQIVKKVWLVDTNDEYEEEEE